MECSRRVEMEAIALNFASQKIGEMNSRCLNIYNSSRELWEVIQRNENLLQWRSSNTVNETRHRLSSLLNPQIDLIQHSWNRFAALLASQGIKARHLSLFYQGMEKPKWIMKMVSHLGLTF